MQTGQKIQCSQSVQSRRLLQVYLLNLKHLLDKRLLSSTHNKDPHQQQMLQLHCIFGCSGHTLIESSANYHWKLKK